MFEASHGERETLEGGNEAVSRLTKVEGAEQRHVDGR